MLEPRAVTQFIPEVCPSRTFEVPNFSLDGTLLRQWHIQRSKQSMMISNLGRYFSLTRFKISEDEIEQVFATCWLVNQLLESMIVTNLLEQISLMGVATGISEPSLVMDVQVSHYNEA